MAGTRQFLVFLVKRLLAGLIMVLVTATFTFFLVRMMPGNPIITRLETLIQQGMNPIQAQHQVQVMYNFMPHQPLLEQWGSYLWSLVHFNLGQSVTYEGVPVMHIILTALPWTVLMVLTGLIMSFVIGILAGVLGAVKRNSATGQAVTLFATLLHGIPAFVIAVVIAYLFSTVWRLFPFGAPYDATIQPGFTLAFIGNLAYHAVLPVAAYAISGFGGWALTMKSSVVSVLGDDFVLAMEIRGLTTWQRFMYIGRSAILPLFTALTISIGFLFGGSIFIEQIFDYPGLGYLLNSAVSARDYPLMDGAFLLITVAVIAFNIVADIVYPLIDPRIRNR